MTSKPPGIYRMTKAPLDGSITARREPDVALALPLEVEQVGEIRVYQILLPFLPESKNVTKTWPPEWLAGVNRKWAKHILAETVAQAIPLGNQRIGLAAKLVFPTRPTGRQQHRDVQNYSSSLWDVTCDALQYCSFECWELRGKPPTEKRHNFKCGVVVEDSEGHVHIGPNWGIRFAYDLRPELPKARRSRTKLTITMKVAADA